MPDRNDRSKLVFVSATGPDQVGLLNLVSSCLTESKIDIVESYTKSMGDFVQIGLLGTVGEERDADLTAEMKLGVIADKHKLSISIRKTCYPVYEEGAEPLDDRFTVWGRDQRGLLSHVTALFVRNRCSIVSHSGSVAARKEGSAILYKMDFEVLLPRGVTHRTIIAELQKLLDDEKIFQYN